MAVGARILVNGDVFDAILPKDMKRYDPRVLHPRLHNRANVLNEAVQMAYELLSPYAQNIDLIGLGNHETAVERHHAFDPVSALIDRLNGLDGAKIVHGDYCGWYVRQFRTGSRGTYTLKLYYHHGMGGAAPVTKGLIDMNRMLTYVEGADVIWIGHKHNRLAVDNVVMGITSQMAPRFRNVLWVQTGAYQRNFPLHDGDTRDRPYSWAQDKGFAPQPHGGTLLTVRLNARIKPGEYGMRVTAQ